MFNIRYKPTKTFFIASAAFLLIGSVTACSKSQSSQTLVAEARQYYQKGDNKAAIIELKNALQKTPDDPEARYLLGTIYYDIGDPKSSENELHRALSLGMNPNKVLPSLGKTLMALGEFQKVLDETNQVSEEEQSAEISSLRGNAYLGLGKGQEAKESFDLALKYKAGYPVALIGLARYSLLEKDIDSATQFTEQAVNQNPEDPDVWQFKG